MLYSLNRLQSISYDTSTADTTYTINAAPTVSFEYMTTGDKTRVKKVDTTGVAEEENAFDSEGRIAEYNRTLMAEPRIRLRLIIRMILLIV